MRTSSCEPPRNTVAYRTRSSAGSSRSKVELGSDQERCSGKVTRPRHFPPVADQFSGGVADRHHDGLSTSDISALLALRAYVSITDTDAHRVVEVPCWNPGAMRRQGASNESARNAASSSSPGRTCAYTFKVTPTSAWPIRCDTTFTGTPLASAAVA